MVEPAPDNLLRAETPKASLKLDIDDSIRISQDLSRGDPGVNGGPPIEDLLNSISMSEQSRPGPNRRNSNARRQPSSTHYSDNVPYQQTSPYSVPYNPQRQTPTYGGQYTLPPPPPPLNMAHTPPPFPYSPGYQVPDMAAQNLHTNYHHQPLLYQYQESMYTGTSPPMSPQPPSQNPPQSPASYTGSATQFSQMRYQSPTPFGFAPPHQSFPASPQVYQSPQYPYSPPFTTGTDPTDNGGGVWYYVPPASSQSFQNPSYPSLNYPTDQSPFLQHQQQPPQQTSTLSSPYPKSPVKSPTFPSVSPPTEGTDAGPSSSNSRPTSEKQPVRRSYHPNPPAHRSEWVMWTGNVPSDANHDELWRFFNQPDDSSEPPGVISIFLISRTNCAFVNYDSESTLDRAIARFNGHPLRPHDPRCPRLLCRVRRKDDDLKAGVGAQRGMGMHIKWIKDHKGKERDEQLSQSGESSEDATPGTPSSYSTGTGVSDDDGSGRGMPFKAKTGSSSGSYASTNSSILLRHFPQRFFILKSLTQYDLDLSVEKGLWATQKHNEGILDQAYRTSKDVYLIFGVNKSGEFYGYAKMAGPVRQGDQRVSWAQRSESSASTRSSPITGRKSDTIPEETSETMKKESPPYFSPQEHRLVENSPSPLPHSNDPLQTQTSVVSAPAELGQQHKKMTLTPPLKFSLDYHLKALTRNPDFELDETAPYKAAKYHRSTSDLPSPTTVTSARSGGGALQSVEEEVDGTPELPPILREDSNSWGEAFKVDWISTKRVPFYRTRHIRNPWNHDREVKVSRDGTELEPGVGQQLIDEWDQLAEGTAPEAPSSSTTDGTAATTKATGGSWKRGSGSAARS